jgi:hypothetical protein
MELMTLLLLALALVIGIVGAGLALGLMSNLRAERARVDSLQSDLRALCSAAVNVGDRMNQIERRLRQLSLRQDELGLQQGQSEATEQRSVEQAAKMVRNGASIEQLVDVCGLSRGEAELVAMMQRLERR